MTALRWLADDLAVSGQIDPEDMDDLRSRGIRVVICNRPDAEVAPALGSPAMARAAQDAGITFVYLPIDRSGIGASHILRLHGLMERAGPGHGILSYCRSGTRSAALWAFSQAGDRTTDDILTALAAAGYAMPGIAGQLDWLKAAEDGAAGVGASSGTVPGGNGDDARRDH